jgi:hypothetical protein
MSRARPSFEFVKGEDAQITWTVYTTEAKTAVENISGWTFALKVKRLSGDADPSLITPTITIISAAAGTVKAVFAAAATALLNGDYTYSFWRTNSGSVTCLALGGTISFLDSTQS